MLTEQAAHELLEGLNTEDDSLHCYCTSDDCDLDKNHIEDEGLSRPRFGMAFVTADGRLDHAANNEAYGWNHGECVQDAADVAISLRDYAEYIEEIVVIDRVTGQWWDGPQFPG